MQCLESIYAKSAGLSFEVILVDNASVECDPEVFKQAYPDIVLIKSATNTGFSGGNNLGIDVAKGDYILLLNSDTELINNAFLLALNIMKADPGIGVLSGQLQYPDGRLQYPASHAPSISLELAQLFRVFGFLPKSVRQSWYLSDQWNHEKSTDADWVWGAFFMVPRYVLNQLPGGRLPHDFFMYVEDMQWCMKIRNLGYRIHYSPEPKCIHHIGGSAVKVQKSPEEMLEAEFRKAIPNQVILLTQLSGHWYPIVLFTLRALMLTSTRVPENVVRAKRFWKMVKELANAY
jgi:GT2 family glycosyltransferase